MGCSGKRYVHKVASSPPPPAVGERGFMKLLYIGDDPPEPYPGQKTGVTYPFDKVNPLFVDKMDAVYLLGPEFEEVL